MPLANRIELAIPKLLLAWIFQCRQERLTRSASSDNIPERYATMMEPCTTMSATRFQKGEPPALFNCCVQSQPPVSEVPMQLRCWGLTPCTSQLDPPVLRRDAAALFSDTRFPEDFWFSRRFLVLFLDGWRLS